MALLRRLSLTDFRSYADALIEPGSGMVVLTGDNGAGKTNVLEAVSLLSPGRGLRGATLSEMARKQGEGGFAVAARIGTPLPRAGGGRRLPGQSGGQAGSDTGRGPSESAAVDQEAHPSIPSRAGEGRPLGEGSIDIGTGTSPSAPERRQVRINGATASAISLAEWLSILWLVPAMDRLFLEAAGGRRRFLDRLVLALEPGHASHSARYEAAMRARNKLLAEEGPDPAWLAALEAAMAENGARIAEARERVLFALSDRLAGQPEGPFARAGLSLQHWRPPDGDAEAALLDALRSGRERDAGAGRTLAGPHRTDLAVTHAGKGEPAERCSTGEQKALLLSITLAHAELVADRAGRHPILLLDEVAAHLDATRRRALFQRLADWGGQVWMTGTETSLFDGADGEVAWLRVAEGTVSRE